MPNLAQHARYCPPCEWEQLLNTRQFITVVFRVCRFYGRLRIQIDQRQSHESSCYLRRRTNLIYQTISSMGLLSI
jgi:hypothetical protein